MEDNVQLSSMSSSELFNLAEDDSDVGDTDNRSAIDKISDDEEKEASDDKVSSSEAVVSEEAEEPEAEDGLEEEAEKADEPEITRKKPFIVKTKNGSEKLSGDARVVLKQDGKNVEVSLQDLTQSYSSKAENAKKFYELQQKERELVSVNSTLKAEFESQHAELTGQIDDYNKTLTELATEAEKGNALGVFARILEGVGAEPLKVVRAIRKELIQNAQGYLALSEQEREALDYKEEVEYLRDKEKRRTLQSERQNQTTAAQKSIAQVMQVYGISSKQEYDRIKSGLEEQARNEGRPRQVTPQEVGQYYKTYQQSLKVVDAVSAVDQGLLQNRDLLQKLLSAVETFDPSKEELIETVKHLTSAATDQGSQKPAPDKKRSFQPKPTKSSETKTISAARKEDLFL